MYYDYREHRDAGTWYFEPLMRGSIDGPALV